jgi:hypothetical protein
MSDELQALCFMAGANSIFYGEKLLTTGNPDTAHDQNLFRRLKIAAEAGADQAADGSVLGERTPADAVYTAQAAPAMESQSAAG